MRRDRLVGWLATVLPRKIAEAPERVLINFACVLIGISALLSERPRSLLAVWPDGFPEAWALAMVFGGGFALVGYWNNPRRRWANSVERLGYLLVLIASLVFGVGAIVAFGWPGVRTGAIFLAIAFAKTIRLLVTSAYRACVLRNGDDGAES